jgi:hypothetical protein
MVYPYTTVQQAASMPPPRNAYGKTSDRDFHIFECKLRIATVTGDMDVAALLSTTGMLCLSNTGFCHFCPVKSEALPTQRQNESTQQLWQ